MKVLISEINHILAGDLSNFEGNVEELLEKVLTFLTPSSADLLKYLPRNISE